MSDADLIARFKNARNRPKCSDTLGFTLLALNQAEMWVEAEFEAREDYCNPMGQIQGGFLCAMLDEVMSVAGVVASRMLNAMPTLEMKTSFLRPALPGQKLRGIGRVVKMGRTIAFTEGELYDAEGKLLAKATGTTLPTAIAKFRQKA